MTIIYGTGYTLPGGDEPLTHARIAHANNWHGFGTPNASTTATGYFDDAPNNSLTYEKWQPTANPSTWETSLGANYSADYCCIAAHDLGSTGCSLQVQYFNGSWLDLIPTTAILDDSPIMVIFEPQSRWQWRINVTVGTVPTIGVIRFGAALQMQRPLYGGHAPADFNRATKMKSNISATGEFLGRTKQRTELQTSFAWQHLTAAWVRTNWGVFQQAYETEPFFVAWRPDTFGEVIYGQTDAPATPTNMGIKSLMSVDLTMRGPGFD